MSGRENFRTGLIALWSLMGLLQLCRHRVAGGHGISLRPVFRLMLPSFYYLLHGIFPGFGWWMLEVGVLRKAIVLKMCFRLSLKLACLLDSLQRKLRCFYYVTSSRGEIDPDLLAARRRLSKQASKQAWTFGSDEYFALG